MPDINELLICVASTMLLNVLRVTMTPVIGHPGRYDKSWTSMILPSTLGHQPSTILNMIHRFFPPSHMKNSWVPVKQTMYKNLYVIL